MWHRAGQDCALSVTIAREKRPVVLKMQAGHGRVEQCARPEAGCAPGHARPPGAAKAGQVKTGPGQEVMRWRLISCLVMTLRWISLVPSPTIISGASRK
jgi:hypothetical protein